MPAFKKYLGWSLWLHSGLFLLVLLAPYLPFSRYKIHEDKITWVELPKGTTNQFGNPMKKAEGLPKTTIEEQKKALESPPAGQKKPLMGYKTKTQKNPPAPARPGHPRSAIDEALSRVQKQVAVKKAQPEAGQVAETQAGGFTYGTATDKYVSPQDPEYVLYQAKIRQKIMNEWIIPLKFTDQALGLICKIVVHINEKGEVTTTEWEQKSGNPAYDLSAMRAVEKASPLDIPPERLKYEVFNEGFGVEFKPQAAGQVAP